MNQSLSICVVEINIDFWEGITILALAVDQVDMRNERQRSGVHSSHSSSNSLTVKFPYKTVAIQHQE